MSLKDFTVFDPFIIHSIRDIHAGGLYAYLKSLGGESAIKTIKNHCNSTTPRIIKSISYLENLGVLAVTQVSSAGKYADDNLLTIIK